MVSYKLLIALLIYFFLASKMFCQQSNQLLLRFQPKFGSTNLNLLPFNYELVNGDTIEFETLKFYISGIELLQQEKITWKEDNSFHLIDLSNKELLLVSLDIPTKLVFETIKFNLGIDSITNVSGALGGDLDPTKGMYWTWQNGYINFKLEGKNKKCSTRNNQFQFHLGGYKHPNYAIQKIYLNIASQKEIKIELDLKQFIKEIDLSIQNKVMSPGTEAVLLSKKVASLFKIVVE